LTHWLKVISKEDLEIKEIMSLMIKK